MNSIERKLQRILNSQCADCARPALENRTLCDKCTIRKAKDSRKMRAKLRKKGICTSCCKRKLYTKNHCKKCNQKIRIAQNKVSAKLRESIAQMEARL